MGIVWFRKAGYRARKGNVIAAWAALMLGDGLASAVEVHTPVNRLTSRRWCEMSVLK